MLDTTARLTPIRPTCQPRRRWDGAEAGHSYVWYDSSGQGWDCAEPGAPEYDPSRDTTTISYGGYTYYCRAAGSATPTATTPPEPTVTSTQTVSPTPPTTSSVRCGRERWNVKTLQDRRSSWVSYSPHSTTVKRLVGIDPPHVGFSTSRIRGVETTTWKLHARLVTFKQEAGDSDIHLVIADPHKASRTMIVEFPNDGCTKEASSRARAKMRSARAAVVAACGTPTDSFRSLHGSATITGVGFFDVKHGQRGVARNGIELHPVLGFSASGCS